MLVALYRTREESRKAGVVHKTPPELMRGLLAVWLRWFPQRKTVFAGDGGFATHELAGFASRHKDCLTLVSKFPPDAVLHDPPPHRKPGQNGRPRVVGMRLPCPRDVVASSVARKRLTVKWYGGGTRRIEVITGTAHWYRQGQGLVPIRWIHVRDLTGTHRDEYFLSTAVRMSLKRIVEAFVGISKSRLKKRESTRDWRRLVDDAATLLCVSNHACSASTRSPSTGSITCPGETEKLFAWTGPARHPSPSLTL